MAMALRYEPAIDTMKAILMHEYGGPDTPRLEETPIPKLRSAEVRVRVRAASDSSGHVATGSGPLGPAQDKEHSSDRRPAPHDTPIERVQ
jgi:hypothetical protein